MGQKPIKLSMIDAAVVFNVLLRGNHPDHTRIANDIRDQMYATTKKQANNERPT